MLDRLPIRAHHARHQVLRALGVIDTEERAGRGGAGRRHRRRSRRREFSIRGRQLLVGRTQIALRYSLDSLRGCDSGCTFPGPAPYWLLSYEPIRNAQGFMDTLMPNLAIRQLEQ